jgi:hypothetical protein
METLRIATVLMLDVDGQLFFFFLAGKSTADAILLTILLFFNIRSN